MISHMYVLLFSSKGWVSIAVTRLLPFCWNSICRMSVNLRFAILLIVRF